MQKHTDRAGAETFWSRQDATGWPDLWRTASRFVSARVPADLVLAYAYRRWPTDPMARAEFLSQADQALARICLNLAASEVRRIEELIGGNDVLDHLDLFERIYDEVRDEWAGGHGMTTVVIH